MQKRREVNTVEYGGNANGQPCVFPFTYKSWTFYTCSNEDDPLGRFWCATTGDYDKDHKWSYCADTRLSTRPTGPCVFPFIYKGKSYMSCTTDGESEGKLWCSLISNYDEDQKWTYCDLSGRETIEGRKGGAARAMCLPFIYEGKIYSSCTTDGSSNGKPWCSLTSIHDENPHWRDCDFSVTSPNQMSFPFGERCTPSLR
ncbi:matrix metalloproteinase-9-like [Zootoca vivipara]|uniref:matrix metalloproteinase-9-like n=1 Tax=Zootoca vivipara TaxID=8524 RepID=UPI00293BCDBD|nr:matrix metalloproteinase-9-like [Zootoca vivipara]